mmetsp:Transcript_39734/g.104963  ORF Transcript_39734/g.104963 Transcript_39734/m.104963 type:complete len:204 (-) Transcript_39734:1106-1717(-)
MTGIWRGRHHHDLVEVTSWALRGQAPHVPPWARARANHQHGLEGRRPRSPYCPGARTRSKLPHAAWWHPWLASQLLLLPRLPRLATRQRVWAVRPGRDAPRSKCHCTLHVKHALDVSAVAKCPNCGCRHQWSWPRWSERPKGLLHRLHAQTMLLHPPWPCATASGATAADGREAGRGGAGVAAGRHAPMAAAVAEGLGAPRRS